MVPKNLLESLYLNDKHSVSHIAKQLGCSQGKINYWLTQYGIPKRSISEALYQSWNPYGDPFIVPKLYTKQDMFLYGVGLGLYWGEGTKSNKTSVRLGNTDPRLIRTFIHFLEKIYGVDRKKLKFGLQVFSDMSPTQARMFWQTYLGTTSAQFQKVIVTPARSIGTYKNKTRHGVLTIYFNNRKLRDIICRAVEGIDSTLSHRPM